MRAVQSSRSPVLPRALTFVFFLQLLLVVVAGVVGLPTLAVASEISSAAVEGDLSDSTTIAASSSSTPLAAASTTQTTTPQPCLMDCPATQPPVPGLPDLPPAANATTVQAIQADAAASIPALKQAVDNAKTVPSKFPIWRKGYPPPPPDGGPAPDPVPPGVIYEEYEVLSEIRKVNTNSSSNSTTTPSGGAVVEAVWVPVSVARPAATSDPCPSNSTSNSTSAKPPAALLLFHSTASSRARTRARLFDAAKRGYVAFAPDARYFGTRAVLWEPCTTNSTSNATSSSSAGELLYLKAKLGGGGLDVSSICPAPERREQATMQIYEDQIVASYESGGTPQRPFMIDNVFDFERVVDWMLFVNANKAISGGNVTLKSLPAKICSLTQRLANATGKPRPPPLFAFDPSRLGATGISLGGFHTTLLAIYDKRIAVAAPAIGVPTFNWGAGHGDEWVARYLSIPKVFDVAAKQAGLARPNAEIYVRVLNVITPGLLGPYDGSSSMPSISPRPFFIVGGGQDPRNPLGGVELAYSRMKKVYESAGAGDKVDYFLDPQAIHVYTPAMEQQVNAWLDKELRP